MMKVGKKRPLPQLFSSHSSPPFAKARTHYSPIQELESAAQEPELTICRAEEVLDRLAEHEITLIARHLPKVSKILCLVTRNRKVARQKRTSLLKRVGKSLLALDSKRSLEDCIRPEPSGKGYEKLALAAIHAALRDCKTANKKNKFTELTLADIRAALGPAGRLVGALAEKLVPKDPASQQDKSFVHIIAQVVSDSDAFESLDGRYRLMGDDSMDKSLVLVLETVLTKAITRLREKSPPCQRLKSLSTAIGRVAKPGHLEPMLKSLDEAKASVIWSALTQVQVAGTEQLVDMLFETAPLGQGWEDRAKQLAHSKGNEAYIKKTAESKLKGLLEDPVAEDIGLIKFLRKLLFEIDPEETKQLFGPKQHARMQEFISKSEKLDWFGHLEISIPAGQAISAKKAKHGPRTEKQKERQQDTNHAQNTLLFMPIKSQQTSQQQQQRFVYISSMSQQSQDSQTQDSAIGPCAPVNLGDESFRLSKNKEEALSRFRLVRKALEDLLKLDSKFDQLKNGVQSAARTLKENEYENPQLVKRFQEANQELTQFVNEQVAIAKDWPFVHNFP